MTARHIPVHFQPSSNTYYTGKVT